VIEPQLRTKYPLIGERWHPWMRRRKNPKAVIMLCTLIADVQCHGKSIVLPKCSARIGNIDNVNINEKGRCEITGPRALVAPWKYRHVSALKMGDAVSSDRSTRARRLNLEDASVSQGPRKTRAVECQLGGPAF
jgi:hypothetical protein